MEQKRELSLTSLGEHPKEIKKQQVVNCLIGDKLVDSFGTPVEDLKIQITSNLTEKDLTMAHHNTALTCSTLFSLFKPNFQSELVNKLVGCVAMGKQYAFCPKVMTQEPSGMDIKEVTEKRKILFISKNNNFQICYCSDNWDYVRADVTDEDLKEILTKYKEGEPLDNKEDLSEINEILTKSGIRTQQDVAERLLKTSPELMLEKSSFTDCSGRTFSNISAFEFVLWALDTRYMVNMMLNCLPKDEIGLKLAAELGKQYYHHQEHGVTYTLEGQIISEKHFDFSVLIKALQDYVDNYDNWTGPQREAHWCKVVGKAQCYVPAHVMQHYCEPNVPFYPLPKFEAAQFVRVLKFDKEMTWAGVSPSSDSVLGENFGIFRCGPGGGKGVRAFRVVAGIDLAAITALYKVRTSDYSAFPARLASLFDKKASLEESPNNLIS
jgi:hypothetical protein